MATTRRPARRWRERVCRAAPLWLAYAPPRVRCRTCGLWVERIPWTEPWQRVTKALGRAGAALAQALPWATGAAPSRLNWKTVAAVGEAQSSGGSTTGRGRPSPSGGSTRGAGGRGSSTSRSWTTSSAAGWSGWARTGRRPPWTGASLGWGPAASAPSRAWVATWGAAYLAAFRRHVPKAPVVFDRFHLSQHLSRAVDEVRRQTWRRMAGPELGEFKGTRFLWLKNPENLTRAEHTRLSALLQLNAPIVKAYLLKEDLRRFWTYRSTAWAAGHLKQWLWRASHRRLEPFTNLAKMLRTHREGVLAWTRIRVTKGALEGMNHKVKVISHRACGFRTTWTYMANIYHDCAELPLP